MRQFAVRVDDDLADRIDEARGDVPRQRWMLRAFEAALGGQVSPGLAQQGRVFTGAAIERGSPSPSLERFAKKGGK